MCLNNPMHPVIVNEMNQILFRILGVRAYEPVDSARNNFRKAFCGPNLFLRYSLCQNPIFANGNEEYRNIDVVNFCGPTIFVAS